MFTTRTALITRPRPRLIEVTRSNLDEYARITEALDFYPAQLVHARVLVFLAKHKIEVFDNQEVHNYMKRQAEEKDKYYRWRPLRRRDTSNISRIDNSENSNSWQGRFRVGEDMPYDKAVPVHILQRVKLIQDHFRDKVGFFVTDYAVPNPDPFIAAAVGNNTPLIIFGVWDEPEFFSKGGN